MTFRLEATVRVTLVASLALLALPLQNSHALRWSGAGNQELAYSNLDPVCRDGTTIAVVRWTNKISGAPLPAPVTINVHLGDFAGPVIASSHLIVTTLPRPALSVALDLVPTPPSPPVANPPYIYYARQKVAWLPLREPSEQVSLKDAGSGGATDPVAIGDCYTVERNRTLEQRHLLAGLLPTGDKKANRHIQRAVEALDRSLAPEFWMSNGLRLTEQGKSVFNEFALAVRQLNKAEPTISAVTAAKAALPDIACGLAATGIEDAVEAQRDAGLIAKADTAAAEGVAQLNAGDPVGAIRQFKLAWARAQRAIGHMSDAFSENAIELGADEE